MSTIGSPAFTRAFRAMAGPAPPGAIWARAIVQITGKRKAATCRRVGLDLDEEAEWLASTSSTTRLRAFGAP